jgi:chaperonin cofactor prefoldin
MAQQTAETFLQNERERFQKSREDLEAERAKIDQQIAEIDTELYALEVYVQAKQRGRPSQTERKPRAAGTRATRAKRGELPGIQKRIAGVVERYQPNGARAESINSELEATDDDAKKKIAAALFRMKKTAVLTQLQARGPYTLGPAYRE